MRKKGDIIDYKALWNHCNVGMMPCTGDEKCLGFFFVANCEQ